MTPARTVRLVRDGFPSPPERDTAVSHAILRRVSDGALPGTLRVHRPGQVVAFGPKDRLEPGFRAAVRAAAGLGYGSVLRLAGGRAAVFDQGTIAFSWAVPDPDPRAGIRRRFQEVSELLRAALADLGVDARVGEVPGEYCPGEFSVNARYKTKLVGVGQRLVLQAAHVGGVVVVTGSDRVREVLVPVYDSLGLGWDPATTGSVEDEVPGVTWEQAAEAIVRRFAEAIAMEDGGLDPETMALAAELEPRHAVPLAGETRP